jgi:hypothetical protein
VWSAPVARLPGQICLAAATAAHRRVREMRRLRAPLFLRIAEVRAMLGLDGAYGLGSSCLAADAAVSSSSP